MLCWRVPANWKISIYWAWLCKWKIFFAKGPRLTFENWLTSWKPKVLPRWSACRTGLFMIQCKLPDIILCIWIQPLVGGAICWNKRWLNALEVSWNVSRLLFILLLCWQVVTWVLLTGAILSSNRTRQDHAEIPKKSSQPVSSSEPSLLSSTFFFWSME